METGRCWRRCPGLTADRLPHRTGTPPDADDRCCSTGRSGARDPGRLDAAVARRRPRPYAQRRSRGDARRSCEAVLRPAVAPFARDHIRDLRRARGDRRPCIPSTARIPAGHRAEDGPGRCPGPDWLRRSLSAPGAADRERAGLEGHLRQQLGHPSRQPHEPPTRGRACRHPQGCIPAGWPHDAPMAARPTIQCRGPLVHRRCSKRKRVIVGRSPHSAPDGLAQALLGCGRHSLAPIHRGTDSRSSLADVAGLAPSTPGTHSPRDWWPINCEETPRVGRDRAPPAATRILTVTEF